MYTKEIAKQIRNEVKQLGGKVSVTFKSFSGGSEIGVSVMQAPLRLKKTAEEITPFAFEQLQDRVYTKDQIINMQNEKYHQLNQYQLNGEYNNDTWNNGVFLTKAGHVWLQKINSIIKKHHRDNSDSSIDYFDCNFYYNINLGKWDNPFIDGN